MAVSDYIGNVETQATTIGDYIRIARPDHWFKNVFVLPGVLIAALLTNTPISEFFGYGRARTPQAFVEEINNDYASVESLDAGT